MRKTLLFSIVSLLVFGCAPKDNRVPVRVMGRVKTSPCERGYVSVGPVAGVTSRAFCVGKYEAHVIDGKAQHGIDSNPSETRKRSDAISYCRANGSKYNLISNNQWQALALSIESAGANWTDGTSGVGALSFGHSDSSPNKALAAGNDNDGCYLNGDDDCESDLWHFQKRTFSLPNGQTIWDVAGNLPEWVRDTPSADLSELAGTEGMIAELQDPTLIKLFGAKTPTPETLESSSGGALGVLVVDQVYANYAVGIVRGGGFNSAVASGVFSARANVAADTDEYDFEPTPIGFRCVYEP